MITMDSVVCSSKPSTIKKVLAQASIFGCVAFLYFFIKETHNCTCISDYLFKDIKIDFTNNESKWLLVRNILLKLSIFLFINVFVVMNTRILSGRSSPATKQDSAFIKLMNRIITNTIQQSVIFLGLYIYFIFDGPYQRLNSIQLLNIASWWFFGRILFEVGYIFGSLVGIPQMRSFGFSISVFVNVMLLDQIFGGPYLTGIFLS